MSCPNPQGHNCACHNGGLDTPCDIPGGCGLPTTPTKHWTRHRADIGADVHDLLTHYLERIHQLLPEPTTGLIDSSNGTHTTTKVTGSPAPWNDDAAGLLFDIHAGARRHEQQLRNLLGYRPIHRTGSDRSSRLALHNLPALVDQVHHHATASNDSLLARIANRTTDDVSSWCREARRILDIDPPASERRNTPAPGGLRCPDCNRRLVLKHGWQFDNAPAVWCLRCPANTDDDHPNGITQSWPADAWLGVLQNGATA